MSKRKNETVRANSSKTITKKAVLNVMADSILENCSVSVKANCIGLANVCSSYRNRCGWA